MFFIVFLLVLTSASFSFGIENYGIEKYDDSQYEDENKAEESLDYSDDAIASSYVDDASTMKSAYSVNQSDDSDTVYNNSPVSLIESQEVKKTKTTTCKITKATTRKTTTCKTTTTACTTPATCSTTCAVDTTSCSTVCADVPTCTTTCSTTCSSKSTKGTTSKITTCKTPKKKKQKKQKRRDDVSTEFQKVRIHKRPGHVFQRGHRTYLSDSDFHSITNNSDSKLLESVDSSEGEIKQASNIAKVYKKLAEDFQILQGILAEQDNVVSNRKRKCGYQTRSAKLGDKNTTNILTIEDVGGPAGTVTRITLLRRSVSEKAKNVDLPINPSGQEVKLKIQNQDDYDEQ